MRIRFQFGLRTLLLSSTIFAAIIGLVEKKAVEQHRLKQSILQLKGDFEQVPSYSWLPSSIGGWIGEDRAMHVRAVNVLGYRAPNYELGAPDPYALVSPARLERLLRLPAMSHVTKLQILGTSVTREVVPALLELNNLRALDLKSTMLVGSDVDRITDSLPDCTVDHSSMAHVTHPLALQVPIEILPDLSVFSRARDGDTTAIEELIEVSAKWTRPGFVIIVANVLRSIEGVDARNALLQGLEHDSKLAQLVVMRGLTENELAPVEMRILDDCLSDLDVAVRRHAVSYALGKGVDRMVGVLERAAMDSDEQVRNDAQRGLEEIRARNGFGMPAISLNSPILLEREP